MADQEWSDGLDERRSSGRSSLPSAISGIERSSGRETWARTRKIESEKDLKKQSEHTHSLDWRELREHAQRERERETERKRERWLWNWGFFGVSGNLGFGKSVFEREHLCTERERERERRKGWGESVWVVVRTAKSTKQVNMISTACFAYSTIYSISNPPSPKSNIEFPFT